jgi:sensor histidine kinase YesM
LIKLQNITNLLIKHRALWHLGFWFLYTASRAAPYYITVMYYEEKFLEFMLITEGAFVCLTYLTIGLYKRFCTKEKYLIYFGLGLTMWLIYIGLVVAFQKYYLASIPYIAKTTWLDIVLNSLMKYLITFILLTMAKYFKDNFILQHYESTQKELQMQSELEQLKAQISPHFLFNTMNNFYGLAVEKSEKLPELMVRLSELLRYSLYETNNRKVPILSEITYLKNYIELEKIRLEDTLDYEFNLKIETNEKIEIAPLIFIVFVENAFKHAKNVEDDVVKIKIDLTIFKDNKLTFTIKNNCLTNTTAIDYNKNGIGLENVRKRLEALYPNDLHTLTVEKLHNLFQVKLDINLNTDT